MKTSSASNISTNAENMFGIQAVDQRRSAARVVHGTERMAMYNNLNGGTSLFYLAQIDAVHAGKTMEIRLFDPGDVGGNAILRLKRPTRRRLRRRHIQLCRRQRPQRHERDLDPDRGRRHEPVSTTRGSRSASRCPTPTARAVTPSNRRARHRPGWWKVQYNITASGNDTTTWEVTIRGNPVHLVVP